MLISLIFFFSEKRVRNQRNVCSKWMEGFKTTTQFSIFFSCCYWGFVYIVLIENTKRKKNSLNSSPLRGLPANNTVELEKKIQNPKKRKNTKMKKNHYFIYFIFCLLVKWLFQFLFVGGMLFPREKLEKKKKKKKKKIGRI